MRTRSRSARLARLPRCEGRWPTGTIVQAWSFSIRFGPSRARSLLRARAIFRSIVVGTAYTVFFHLPPAVARSDEPIFSGDGRIAENIGVKSRIYPVQAARDH